MNRQATAGQIVHWYPEYLEVQGDRPLRGQPAPGAPVAAIVNNDSEPDGRASLTIFSGQEPSIYINCPYAEEPTASHWSWMSARKDVVHEAAMPEYYCTRCGGTRCRCLERMQ